MTLPSRLGLNNKRDAWAALLVTLAPLAFFHQAVAGRLFISPDDGVIFNVPLRVAAARIALDGHLPLWNPYLFSGMPLHGAAQAGLLFPLNWFYLAFDAPAATNLMMLSAYAVAALGAYLYARRSGSGVAGAVVTSLAYQWSGFLVAQIGHTNVVQVAALLPWLLWAVDGYGATGKRGRGLLVAAVVCLQALAGHQQTLVYSLLLASTYALVMHRASRPARSWYLWSLVLLAAGMLLAAVQILPTYELMRNSVRAGTSYDFFSSFSLPPRFLLTFLAPYVLGGGDGALFRAPYIEQPYYGEYIGYVGLLTLMLAALAVALRKSDTRTKFWAAAVLVALALALGRNWPFKLYGVVYYVPVLNLFRVPARHMMEVNFALAVLAGRGLTAIITDENRARVRKWSLAVGASMLFLTLLVVTVGRPPEFRLSRAAPVSLLRAPELFMPVALAALSVWALWRFARRTSRAALLFLLAVLVLDLCLWGQSSGWRGSSPRPESPLWTGPPPVKFLREREGQGEGLFRILTVWQSFDPAVRFDESMTPGPNEFALHPNIYMMHGIQNAAGYDGFGLARYSRLAGDMKLWGELTDAERTLRGAGRELDLLNVRYLLSMRRRTGATASKSAGAPPKSTPHNAPGGEFPAATRDYGGFMFVESDMGLPNLKGGERLSFSVPPVEAERVALLTNLSWAEGVPDGTTVGRVRLRASDGRIFEFELRAGADTSEWGYDRPDVRARIRHARAPLAMSYAVKDAQGEYEGHTYVTSFALPEKVTVEGVEVVAENLPRWPDLLFGVFRVSLVGGGRYFPLRREWVVEDMDAGSRPAEVDGGRWRLLAQTAWVDIYENARTLPRAWLAEELNWLSDSAILQTIRTGRLPDGKEWDPRRTALISLPQTFKGGSFGAGGRREATVTRHEPNRVEVKTSSDAPSVLVLSENHYPGWRAYIDGRAVETLRVNYNLRGVALPAGEHTVEFVYRPKSVLVGLAVSLLTLVALAFLSSRFAPTRGWAGRLLARRKNRQPQQDAE